MKYFGGKGKGTDAREIVKILESVRAPGQLVIDVFCGACNILRHLKGPRLGIDLHQGIVTTMSAARDGWEPPPCPDLETYRAFCSLPMTDPRYAYAAFGCSFGGRERGGFAAGVHPNDVQGRHYWELVKVSLQRKGSDLQGAEILCAPYTVLDPSYVRGCLVYCDPPYLGTTGFKTGAFDHLAFYQWAESLSTYNVVIVSEERAPAHWPEIWSKQRKHQVRSSTKAERIERLFWVRTC